MTPTRPVRDLRGVTAARRVAAAPVAAGPSLVRTSFFTVGVYAAAEERIKIVATRNKESLLPLGFKEGIFQVYDEKSTGMIGDLVRKLNQIELTDWTEATAVYNLKRR